jgi:hypothetical protein
MSSVDRTVPPVSIVIGWPQSIPAAPLPQAVFRKLEEVGIVATWAIETPGQAKSLLARAGKFGEIDAAMRMADNDGAEMAASLERGLETFRAANQSVAAIEISGSLKRGQTERHLCQLGIRSVIGGVKKSRSTVIRSLPFGICEFTPNLQIPAKRRLWPFWSRRQAYHPPADASPTVVSIDLGHIGSIHESPWRQAERVIGHAAEAHESGLARVVSVSQLAAELSRPSSSRPQRSILRAA